MAHVPKELHPYGYYILNKHLTNSNLLIEYVVEVCVSLVASSTKASALSLVGGADTLTT